MRPLTAGRRLPFAERFWPASVFVLMALSSFVQHEPAPYDLLLLSGMFLFVLSGQKIPAKLAWPALSIVLVIFGYCIGAMFAQYQQDAFFYIRTSTYLSVSLIFF